jgi:hypothetical protein
MRTLSPWIFLAAGCCDALALAQDFVEMPTIADWELRRPHVATVIDIDQDGLEDVVVADWERDSVSYYRSRGDGAFEAQVLITTEADGASAIDAADLDGDGDLDLIATSWFDQQVAWYENLGAGAFGSEQVLALAGGSRGVDCGDLDGDGDLDVLYTSSLDDQLCWLENLGSGQFAVARVIRSVDGAWAVLAEDCDGDGDLDALVSGFDAGVVSWLPNDGAAGFGAVQVVTAQAAGARGLSAADLDGDGDLDVVSASDADSKVAWHENLGAGLFGPEQVLTLEALGPWGVHAADLDGDGDLEVLCASHDDNRVTWFENQGAGSFGPLQVLDGDARGAHTVATGDFDADGDLDTVVAEFQSFVGIVSWCENLGTGSFAEPRVVNELPAHDVKAIRAADLDGDGDLDVVSSNLSDKVIVWHENLGGGEFGGQRPVTPPNPSPFHESYDFECRDLDGDGDLDVVMANFFGSRIGLLENLGGGVFSPPSLVTNSVEEPSLVRLADLDGDGDLDLLTADAYAGTINQASQEKVAWCENLGGLVFGPLQVITTEVDSPEAIEAADLDGDGDLDVLSSSRLDDKVAWYENTGGGQFGPQELISQQPLGPTFLAAADLDGDGDLDVVSAGRDHLTGSWQDHVAWFENLGGGAFSSPHFLLLEVPEPPFFDDLGLYPSALDARDLDMDGDVDLLCSFSLSDELGWYENEGGGTFAEFAVIADFSDGGQDTLRHATSLVIADLDADGSTDILAAARFIDRLLWLRNVTTRLDCDGDGVEDASQITAEPWRDADQNGVLDACEGGGPYWFRSPITQRVYCSLPPMTWQAADLVAAQLAGHLVTIRSEYEDAWLQAAFAGTPHWTGYNDLAVEGQFVWANGESATYENFGPGGPGSIAPDQDFVASEGLGAGAWEVLLGADLRAAVVESDSIDCDANLIADHLEIQADPSLDCDLDGFLDACRIADDPSLDCDANGVLDACEIALDPSLDCYANGVLDSCEELPPAEDFNGDGLADACFPPNYCSANPNSSGNTASLTLEGTPLLAAADLRVHATGCAIQEWSYFVMSQSQDFMPGFGGSAGNLCVGAPIVRFNRNLVQVRKTNLAGARSYVLDFSGSPEDQILLGQTWNFQLWFRDGMSSNTSDAVTVLFR